MHLRSFILLPVFAVALFPLTGKKEQLLQLCKKYFPENYAVVEDYDEVSINDLASGDSLKDFIGTVPTIIHEGYHHYHGIHSSYYDSVLVYRMNDTLRFQVKNLKTFPSREINSLVPETIKKKIFRYGTYVDVKDKYLVTQQYGILGLLEEQAAYYQSMHTSIALFKYYKDQYGWKNPERWTSYLGTVSSYRFALTEFELFISWYIQFAKAKQPAVYRDIMNNTGLKKMLVFLHTENIRLAAQYDSNRKEIISQFKGGLVIKGNYIVNTETHVGMGLHDEEVKEMNLLLSKPEHQLYKDLLR